MCDKNDDKVLLKEIDACCTKIEKILRGIMKGPLSPETRSALYAELELYQKLSWFYGAVDGRISRGEYADLIKDAFSEHKEHKENEERKKCLSLGEDMKIESKSRIHSVFGGYFEKARKKK